MKISRGPVHGALLGLLAACSAGKAPETAAVAAPVVETLATTRQLMMGITNPAANVLSQIGDHPPQDDAAWDLVVANSLAVAESGNLLLTGTRNLQQPEWTALAMNLIEKAKATALAAQEKDVDRVIATGNDLSEVCVSCHTKYLPEPPPVEMPTELPPGWK